jgi:hypothetical protein
LENKITEAQALSGLEGNIYLPLYQFLVYRLKGSTTQSALDDYDGEHRAFLHTFEATSDWHCLRRRARRNIVSIKEGQEGNHRYPSSWESLGVEKKKEMHKTFVRETLTELHFLGSLGDKAPMQNELRRRVFDLVKSNTVYMATVFAMQSSPQSI